MVNMPPFIALAILLCLSFCSANPPLHEPTLLSRAEKEIVKREQYLDRSATLARYRTLHPDKNATEWDPMTAVPHHPLTYRLCEQILQHAKSLAGEDPNLAKETAQDALERLPDYQRDAVHRLLLRSQQNHRVISLPRELSDMIYRIAVRSHIQEELGQPTIIDPNELARMAVTFGRSDLLDYLIWLGAEPNARDSGGCSLLQMAVRLGDVEVAERLLFYDADVRQIAKDGTTMLWHAIGSRDGNMFNLLIHAGIDRDWVPADYNVHLSRAVFKHFLAAAEYCIEKGASVHESIGDAPLLLLAISKRELDMVDLLIRHGANVDWRHGTRTMLYYAMRRGTNEIILRLIEAGARVEHRLANFILLEAVFSNDVTLAQVALAHGADIAWEARHGTSLLIRAVRFRYYSMVEILLRAGANVHYRDANHRSALYHALEVGTDDVARLLMRYGAPIDFKCLPNGERLAYRAIQNDNAEFLKIYLNTGVNVNHRDGLGVSLIAAAVVKDKVKCVQLLLEYGADPTLKDNHGGSALTFAKGDMLKMLQRAAL